MFFEHLIAYQTSANILIAIFIVWNLDESLLSPYWPLYIVFLCSDNLYIFGLDTKQK